MGVLSRSLHTELNSVCKSELKPQQESAINDLFIGCVASKGTPAEKRSLARHLDAWADEQELLEQTQQQNKQLEERNHQLEYENKLKDTEIHIDTVQINNWMSKCNRKSFLNMPDNM